MEADLGLRWARELRYLTLRLIQYSTLNNDDTEYNFNHFKEYCS